MNIPKQKKLVEWVSRLITDKIEEDWDFGLEPFTRLDQAPEVSFSPSRSAFNSFTRLPPDLAGLSHSFVSSRWLKILK